MQQRVIAMVNQKGGVGKSTTTANLSYILAKSGRSVLVFDLDSQANLTLGFGISPETVNKTVRDAFLDPGALLSGIALEHSAGLYIVPSSEELLGLELDIVGLESPHTLLRNLINQGRAFDYVLLDCPADMGIITVNALAAATEVIVPYVAAWYCTHGLGLIMRSIEKIRAGLNPGLKFRGILRTMKMDDSIQSGLWADVKEQYPGKCFAAEIPKNNAIDKAQAYGLPVSVYEPNSKGSVAYKELALEIISQEK